MQDVTLFHKINVMEKITEALATIFGMNILRYFLIAGVPFAFFYWVLPNTLKKFKIQQKQAKSKDFWREIAHSMQSTIVFAVLAVLVLFTPLRQYTLVYDNLNDFGNWYIGLSLILALVIHDTYFYWMHRLMHHKALFKLTHVVHHKSTNPSPWTSYSFQLAEAILEGAVLIPVVLLLPMHATTILLFTVAGFIINVYGHLGYEIMPKAFRYTWLFQVLNTSVYHNMHHSRFKGNYGLYFRFWDRVMHTENPDYEREYDRLQNQRFGTR